ncbi:MAG: extracellular solute-binding protein [Oscillospiraceae bacterium]|nr:extracellular solute-binding protein [Oscillospiraceae bacterium]
MKKRIIAFVLAGIMMLSLAACSKSGGKVAKAPDEPLTKEDVIDVTILSNASWPYNENWKVWEYIREEIGATINVNAVPSSEYATKYPLMFAAPDTLPDVVAFDSKPATDKFAIQGAFIALEDMQEYMPNYNAWLETLSDEDIENVVNIRKAYDGKIYYTPATGREATRGVRCWLYRKDIFDKHGIAVPKTFDELYEACKKLKELYPESFPFAMRSGMTNLAVTGPSWKEYWAPGVYYDYINEKWEFGAREEIMREMLEFYKKMVAEKLMPSDFMTMNTSTWQELISTSRGFIFPEYQTRINFFNTLAREQNPDFNLTAMMPPVANKETGVARVGRYNYETMGYVICNTGKEANMVNAAKYIDWFYSDKAMDLVSWGKEGETYKTVNGKREFISDETGTDVTLLYGFATFGSFLRIDPESTIAQLDEDTAAVIDFITDYAEPKFSPTANLAFNDEESKTIEETNAACKTYSEEMMTKFILGQEPISGFDKYVETLNSMGVDKLLGAYESAYNRVK